MNIDVAITTYPVTPYLQAGTAPEYAFNREEGQTYFIRVVPLGEDQSRPSWAVTQQGDIVAIPLIPYLMPTTNLPVLIKEVLSLVFKSLPRDTEVHRLIIVIGDPIESSQVNGRVWLGIAAQ